MLCLAISTGTFVSVSDVWIFTAATAIPFAGAVMLASGCLKGSLQGIRERVMS